LGLKEFNKLKETVLYKIYAECPHGISVISSFITPPLQVEMDIKKGSPNPTNEIFHRE
jgi:hypothetical protein